MITYKRSTLVNSEKYIGLDIHQATISVAVLDDTGKLVMECILETKATTILEFFAGLRGTLSVTFEEGTSAAWLYDLLKPHISRPLAPAPHPRSNRRWGKRNLSYSYVNESRGQVTISAIRPNPWCQRVGLRA